MSRSDKETVDLTFKGLTPTLAAALLARVSGETVEAEKPKKQTKTKQKPEKESKPDKPEPPSDEALRDLAAKALVADKEAFVKALSDRSASRLTEVAEDDREDLFAALTKIVEASE